MIEEIQRIQADARDKRLQGASALAHDRLALTEGLDRAEGGRWPADRRNIPFASGAAGRPERPIRNISKLLEEWLKSYRPEELFDKQGRLKPELAELAPNG